MLFFYIYCFLGWLWESTYVSVRRREWVNRGFMHGPFLPIYGSGAIVILFTTLAFRENLWMIYLLGMISATILEYFTGAAMEKLFHVRYWDYTGHRFNLKGRVCLSVSLGWGLFSVLLVKFIHPRIIRKAYSTYVPTAIRIWIHCLPEWKIAPEERLWAPE